jgi:hypothetical protein
MKRPRLLLLPAKGSSMEDEDLIEALNEICPDWRDHYDSPQDAANDYIPDWRDMEKPDQYVPLDFS